MSRVEKTQELIEELSQSTSNAAYRTEKLLENLCMTMAIMCDEAYPDAETDD